MRSNFYLVLSFLFLGMSVWNFIEEDYLWLILTLLFGAYDFHQYRELKKIEKTNITKNK